MSFVAVRTKQVLIIVRIHFPAQGKLLHVIHALDSLGFLLCLTQRRQQHRGEDGYDCDYDQELDQGEAGGGSPPGTIMPHSAFKVLPRTHISSVILPLHVW